MAAAAEGAKVTMVPYLVKRTEKARWLPVYKDISHNKSKITTIIRRIEGDVDVRIVYFPRLH
jgi:hypothetical protein